ncbi:hypothetical protein [Nostoc sp.]|uniref:hypothetical protein n=1 Tax=Nostoc sp. TaxID=1180 RepID=UPI002FF69BCD
MEITRSHIENVRRVAKDKGISSPTSEQIREAIAQFYDSEDAEFNTADIPQIVDILLAQQPPQPLGIFSELSIVVAEEEKHNLVAETAQQIGVNLVASEIKQIAQGIASGFDSREQLFNEVTNAIVAFIEYRIGAQSDTLKDAALRIRAKLGEGNSATRDVFHAIRQDVDSTNTDFKRHLEGITALFTIPS